MKMKKFMNAPETVTDEELVGLGLAYPDILNVDGHLVISKDLANADRVTIVTYGGSGHEPAQAGFVGKGMLDIQAVGDIFAAPNGQLVFDAMKMADKGHGVLLLTLNYAMYLKENFYILPSSVHEMIILPESGALPKEELNAVIQEINGSQVNAEEYLSDHAYYYDRVRKCVM